MDSIEIYFVFFEFYCIFYGFLKFIQIIGIINKNEKLKNPGTQCWAALWPTVLACRTSPAGEAAHGSVTRRVHRARS
jgi:hypothetical protein